MLFDSTMLARAAGDAERGLVGVRVRDVIEARHDEVCLRFARGGDLPCLLLSSSPEEGRVEMAAACPTPPPAPFPFCMALRKHLRGAILDTVEHVRYDRLLRLTFSGCEGFGPESRRDLIAEIMGKHANLILVDESDVIVACAKHVTERVNRYRQTREGETYILPPGGERLDPRAVTGAQLCGRADEWPHAGLAELLTRCCMGAGPVMAAEVQARADLGDRPVRALSAAEHEQAAAALRALCAEAHAPGPAYVYETLLPGRRSPTLLAYPVRLASLGEPEAQFEHLGAALEHVVERTRERRVEQELRARLQGAVAAAVQSVRERQTQHRRSLAKAEATAELARKAELIMSQLHAIAPDADEARLVDWHDPAQPEVTIALDPALGPQRTAERHFAAHKRGQRVLVRVPALLAEAEAEERYLESVGTEIELAEGLDELTAVEHELLTQGTLKARRRQAAPRTRRDVPVLPSFETADGYSVLYGRNHAQNEQLLREAAPDDLWLHVRDGPGGHVLIRTGGDPEAVPPRTLLQAAQRAVALSRQRNEAVVEVDYTAAKHVRRPRDARPGMVLYTHQKTLAVRRADG